MLIFFKSLSLCVFVFKSTDCAFADDSREAETGTGRVVCVFDSFNFFRKLFLSLPFHFLLEMNEIMGAVDHRSAEGQSISMARARSRFRARVV